MGKVEDYTSFMEKIANDNSHGYDQINRWAPDYDCSSLVITAIQNAGIPVKTNGATYTGNMLPVFIKCGFTDVTNIVNRTTGAGLIRGDILLDVVNHTAVYCGNGKLVQASINENGGITGGRTGDQTGNEINIRGYYNYPWTNILRFVESVPASKKVETKKFKFVNADILGKSCTFTGFMENNENWIKATAALEVVGYTAKWDNTKKRVIAVKDGKEKLLDIRTYISVDSISFCPLRELFEYLGYKVSWNGETKKITVTE